MEGNGLVPDGALAFQVPRPEFSCLGKLKVHRRAEFRFVGIVQISFAGRDEAYETVRVAGDEVRNLRCKVSRMAFPAIFSFKFLNSTSSSTDEGILTASHLSRSMNMREATSSKMPFILTALNGCL